MQKVLITGGAGFIGSNLAHYLQVEGRTPIVLDDLSLGRPDNLPADVQLTIGDVARECTWSEVSATDAVVHLAGASSAPMFPDRLSCCFENNIIGFIRVLDYAKALGIRRVVYASTSSVYGNVHPPLQESGPVDIPNFYAVSKYCMEQIAAIYSRQYGMDIVGLRFMSVYGPREEHKGRLANLVSQFIWDVEAGEPPVVYGDGSQTRDFTNVADICQAILRVLAHPNALGSSVFNVGSGKETPINELIGLLSEAMGVVVTPQYIPNPVVSGYVRQQLADLTRIKTTLGYEPKRTLRDGVAEILRLRSSRRALGSAV